MGSSVRILGIPTRFLCCLFVSFLFWHSEIGHGLTKEGDSYVFVGPSPNQRGMVDFSYQRYGWFVVCGGGPHNCQSQQYLYPLSFPLRGGNCTDCFLWNIGKKSGLVPEFSKAEKGGGSQKFAKTRRGGRPVGDCGDPSPVDRVTLVGQVFRGGGWRRFAPTGGSRPNRQTHWRERSACSVEKGREEAPCTSGSFYLLLYFPSVSHPFSMKAKNLQKWLF